MSKAVEILNSRKWHQLNVGLFLIFCIVACFFSFEYGAMMLATLPLLAFGQSALFLYLCSLIRMPAAALAAGLVVALISEYTRLDGINGARARLGLDEVDYVGVINYGRVYICLVFISSCALLHQKINSAIEKHKAAKAQEKAVS